MRVATFYDLPGIPEGASEEPLGQEQESEHRVFANYPPLIPEGVPAEQLDKIRKAWDEELGDNPEPKLYFDEAWITGKKIERSKIHGFQGASYNNPDTGEIDWSDGREAFTKWLKGKPDLLNSLGVDATALEKALASGHGFLETE